MSKTAVILFNLGGPDRLSAVRPFLFNLFNDAAIIRLPQPFRWIVAQLISLMRASRARSIYQHMGGKSPILEQTTAQAGALEKQLNARRHRKEDDYKTFVCMRHWHPMSDVVAKKVKSYAPDHIVLLPLYPQYSTTTTGSSLLDWENASRKAGLKAPTSALCCYPADRGFVAAHARLIRDMYWRASEQGKPRILFSAHGLPEKIIASGDPYQWQVEKTVDAVIGVLAIDDADYAVCYQSRVGIADWIEPSTAEEIIRAGEDKVPVLIVPVAFVCEHSETLVELDIDYRKLAAAHNVPGYWRTPALGVEPLFIEALAGLCLGVAGGGEDKIQSFTKARYCSGTFDQCPCRAAA